MPEKLYNLKVVYAAGGRRFASRAVSQIMHAFTAHAAKQADKCMGGQSCMRAPDVKSFWHTFNHAQNMQTGNFSAESQLTMPSTRRVRDMLFATIGLWIATKG